MWRNMMRVCVDPTARDASTKSRSLSASTCPRTRRATPTQFTSASATKSRNNPFRNWPMAVARSAVITMMKKSRSGKA
jgi:hypothetical protein